MKYIKKFNADFKVGDIVVAIDNKYAFMSKWINKGTKYKIVDIEQNNEVEDRIEVEGLNGETFFSHFFKDLFISEAEYDSKKYGI